jgi:KDO2-lipid IV(A) lauroyltransferase
MRRDYAVPSLLATRGRTILKAMTADAVVSGEGKDLGGVMGATLASRRPRWYWHQYNRAGLYRFAEALAWVPRERRLGLAWRVGAYASRFLPAERAAIRMTLERITGASGPRLDALTTDVFRDFAMCFSDLLTTNRQPVARLMGYVASVSIGDPVPALTGGFVSVTAHVGNWELAGRLLAGKAARRTNVVVAPEDAPHVERWVRRDGDGVRFVPRTHPRIAVELLAALRRGEVVALQGDRALGTRGDVEIPFFGRPAPFPMGPFLLARAAGVPVVPAFCVLDGERRYAVRITGPIAVRRGEEEGAARAWVALLEDVVREHPTQWFNFFDVWDPWGGPATDSSAARRPGPLPAAGR